MTIAISHALLGLQISGLALALLAPTSGPWTRRILLATCALWALLVALAFAAPPPRPFAPEECRVFPGVIHEGCR